MTEQNAKRGSKIVDDLIMYRKFLDTMNQPQLATAALIIDLFGVAKIATIGHKDFFKKTIEKIISELEKELENL